MRPAVKAVVVLAGIALALNAVLALFQLLLGGTPGGPPSSAYATGSSGVAAYAALLARSGHSVERLNEAPSRTPLDPDETIMLLDPGRPVGAADASALRRFVSGGGQLVVAGPTGAWLSRIVADAPRWSASPATPLRTFAPLPGFAAIDRLDAAGPGSWLGGGALPLLGGDGRVLLSLALEGSGRVWLLANVAPLENGRLARADDAALGLALAGDGRPVIFLESYHGFSPATGLAAIPSRWWVAFALLAAAAVTVMLAVGRRFGPPQASERSLAPPRREYVDSLAAILARSRQREAAVAPVRAHLRRAIAERATLAADVSDAQLRAAAVRLGLSEPDAEILVRDVLTDDDVVALGRTLIALHGESST